MKPHCLALLLSLVASGLSGQETATVSPGSRVRVAIVDPALRADLPNVVIVGTLESIGNSLIVVQRPGGESFSIPAANAHLFVSRGAGYCGSGHRGTCVALGVLGGAAFGFAVPALLRSVEDEARDVSTKVMKVSIPLGAVVGAVIGAKAGRERWQRVDISPFLTAEGDPGRALSARPRLSVAMHIVS